MHSQGIGLLIVFIVAFLLSAWSQHERFSESNEASWFTKRVHARMAYISGCLSDVLMAAGLIAMLWTVYGGDL